MDSILDTVKKYLGYEPDYLDFDTDILLHINMAIQNLAQIGVGPENPFVVKSSVETWNDYLGDSIHLESVKMYICMQCKMFFDSTSIPSSFVLDALKSKCDEIEWRLNVLVDKG